MNFLRLRRVPVSLFVVLAFQDLKRDTEPVSVVKMTVNHSVVQKHSFCRVTETIEWFPNKKVFSSFFNGDQKEIIIRNDFFKNDMR